MNEKKVIAFIVEGPSEEASLGTVMSEYFSGSRVKFTVVHGDITLKDYVSVDGILKKIKDQIDSVKRKYRYDTDDFMKIIHLTDTDGVFIQDRDIVPGALDTIEYYTDHIETAHIGSTVKRNHRKAEILLKLRRTGKINGISYKIYFNSCNLEHVLYNTLEDFSDEDKQKMSDDFAEKYEGNIDKFIEFVSCSEFAVPGTYQKTWDFIEKSRNSLKRYSNMSLLFADKN